MQSLKNFWWKLAELFICEDGQIKTEEEKKEDKWSWAVPSSEQFHYVWLSVKLIINQPFRQKLRKALTNQTCWILICDQPLNDPHQSWKHSLGEVFSGNKNVVIVILHVSENLDFHKAMFKNLIMEAVKDGQY